MCFETNKREEILTDNDKIHHTCSKLDAQYTFKISASYLERLLENTCAKLGTFFRVTRYVFTYLGHQVTLTRHLLGYFATRDLLGGGGVKRPHVISFGPKLTSSTPEI